MKRAYSLTFDGDMVKAVVPSELILEVMRVEAEQDTDFPTACRLVAERSNSGSAKFKKDVKEEARRQYNSQLMKQLNAARMTITTNSFNEGYEAGVRDAQSYYFCNICGSKILRFGVPH